MAHSLDEPPIKYQELGKSRVSTQIIPTFREFLNIRRRPDPFWRSGSASRDILDIQKLIINCGFPFFTRNSSLSCYKTSLLEWDIRCGIAYPDGVLQILWEEQNLKLCDSHYFSHQWQLLRPERVKYYGKSMQDCDFDQLLLRLRVATEWLWMNSLVLPLCNHPSPKIASEVSSVTSLIPEGTWRLTNVPVGSRLNQKLPGSQQLRWKKFSGFQIFFNVA